MGCSVTLTIVEESLNGDIGDDWEYSVEIKVYNPASATTPVSAGTISVPEHRIAPGTSQSPPPGTTGLILEAGPCESVARVDLTFTASELDLISDDTEVDSRGLTVACPGPGQEPHRATYRPRLTVRESGGDGIAALTLTIEVESACD